MHLVRDNIKALVIDDDRLMRTMLSTHLESSGFEVYLATNGREGSHQLKNITDIDLVITDMIMPEKEGLETISYLKKNRPDLKIIAISGGGLFKAGDLLGMAKKFGADAVFAKPIDFDELDNAIRAMF